MHHSAALTGETGEPALAEAVVSGDWGSLPARLQELLHYAIALTVSPRDVQRSAVQRLQAAGLSARDVIDANQVVAYFNYVNRVADGLGVELEAYWPDEVRAKRTYPVREHLE